MHSLEAEPLLTVDRATESNTTSQAGSPAGKAKTSQDFNFRNERAVILTFTMYFIYYFICIYLNVPIIRLVEYAVCERHFRADSNPVKAPVTLKDMDELLCKIKPVQAEVAIILGVRFSLEALAGMARTKSSAFKYNTEHVDRIFNCAILQFYRGSVWQEISPGSRMHRRSICYRMDSAHLYAIVKAPNLSMPRALRSADPYQVNTMSILTLGSYGYLLSSS